jgi:hypothetical protein
MPFRPGQSGNPAGRPRGARNKANVFIETLLESDGEAFVYRLIEQAKAGNTRVLAHLMGIILPKREGAPIEIDLPPLEKASDAPAAIACIISAVSAGDLTPDEGIILTRMVEAFMRTSQKVERLARNAEQVARIAASQMREADSHVSRGAEAPSSEPTVPLVDNPNLAAEPPIHSPVAEQVQALLAERSGANLRRLRQEALRSTSALAQTPGDGGRIVSALLIPRGAAPESPQAAGSHCIPIADPRVPRSARVETRAAA